MSERLPEPRSPIAPHRRKEALLLANSVCLDKRGLSRDGLVDLLAQAGIAAESADLPPAADLEALRDQVLAGGYNMVVAAGGDGTVHVVANVAAPLGLPMGVLPLGTANDFARTLGLPADLAAAAHIIAEAPPVAIDLGRVNGRYFLNAAHVGLGVETARRTSTTLKRLIGPVAYILAAAQAWLTVEPLPIEVCSESECLKLQAAQLLVGNGRYYGGGMVVAPDATLDDGLLDAYVLSAGVSKAELLRLAAATRRGTLGEHPDIVYFRTPRLSAALPGPVQINLDGELLSMDKCLTFEVIPRALSVYAPAALVEPAWEPGALLAETQ